jgi:hypothetical protein
MKDRYDKMIVILPMLYAILILMENAPPCGHKLQGPAHLLLVQSSAGEK